MPGGFGDGLRAEDGFRAAERAATLDASAEAAAGLPQGCPQKRGQELLLLAPFLQQCHLIDEYRHEAGASG
jgi:hypothetical protein